MAQNEFAPPPILRAALRVLYVCSYETRNWTLADDVSRKQINDLWEAIHPIPNLLYNCRDNAEGDLFMYFDEYNERWPTPHLRVIYEQALESEHF